MNDFRHPQRRAQKRIARHWKPWLLEALILLILLGGFCRNLSPAWADAQITVTSTRAQVNFPLGATFTIAATSASSITAVSLEVNTPGKSYGAIPVDLPADARTFHPGTAVTQRWDWRSPGNIAPGSEIAYRWLLTDATGGSLWTPLQMVRYEDPRYSWKKLTATGVNLYWYQGDPSFGQELLASTTDGLQALHQQQGIDLRDPVNVYIYATQDALRGAMVSSPVWIGGRSYPEFNTILLAISIASGELDRGRRALVHELTHQLVYQQTFNPLIGSQLPLWLNEGLAVVSEGATLPQFRDALSGAVSNDTLPTLRRLDGNFPADTHASDIAYAESESFVRYLLARAGPEKMRELLGVLQFGSRIDPALQTVYASDLDRLQDGWRESIGAKPLGHTPNLGKAAAVATVSPITIPPRAAGAAAPQRAKLSPFDLLVVGLSLVALAFVGAMVIMVQRMTRRSGAA
ncbi:MAG: peptidase MA family metallohydrolase [Dehalococcoidia bacterium]